MQKISAPQRERLLTLAAERTFPTIADEDRLIKCLRISEDPEEFGMSFDTAMASIAWMERRPFKSFRDPVQAAYEAPMKLTRITEPGVFENEHGIFVVKPNRKGDRLYAKRLVEIGGERLNAEGDHVAFDFEYAPGAMRHLREEHRMDVDRAKELTLRYGRCINCARRLKAAKSVEEGIGPVCIKRFRQVIAA